MESKPTPRALETHLVEPGRGISPRIATSYGSCKCPLLKAIGTTLDSQEDETTEERVGDEERANSEIDDEALEEGVMTGLVGYTTEAQTPDLSILLLLLLLMMMMRHSGIDAALWRIDSSLERRSVAIVGSFQALVGSVVTFAVLLHCLYIWCTKPFDRFSRAVILLVLSLASSVSRVPCYFLMKLYLESKLRDLWLEEETRVAGCFNSSSKRLPISFRKFSSPCKNSMRTTFVQSDPSCTARYRSTCTIRFTG